MLHFSDELLAHELLPTYIQTNHKASTRRTGFCHLWGPDFWCLHKCPLKTHFWERSHV